MYYALITVDKQKYFCGMGNTKRTARMVGEGNLYAVNLERPEDEQINERVMLYAGRGDKLDQRYPHLMEINPPEEPHSVAKSQLTCNSCGKEIATAFDPSLKHMERGMKNFAEFWNGEKFTPLCKACVAEIWLMVTT